MSEFVVYPAIDLREGQVVRLVQGDPERQTIYSRDPGAMARAWLGQGAGWLHVVNLDGAFGARDQKNQAALKAILEVAAACTPPARVQFGGGLRTPADILRVIDLGVSRALLGTAAVEEPVVAEQALARYGPEKIGLAIDARDGVVRVRGWAKGAGVDSLALARRYAAAGVRMAVYTDIRRDGVPTGVNLPAAQRIAEQTGLEVIVSGGVAGLEDVRRVREAGLSGIIIGRALYEGIVDLREALAC